MSIEFKQAIFAFECEELQYEVFFTTLDSLRNHIKVVKEGADRPIYSKEKPMDYEWFPSEMVAHEILEQLIN